MSMNIPDQTIRKAHDVAARINLGLWSWSDRNYMTEQGFAIIASALHSAQMEERERVKAAIAKRMAVYEAKRDSSDPLAEDSYTRHQLFSHAAEAMEWLMGELYPDTAIRTTKAD